MIVLKNSFLDQRPQATTMAFCNGLPSSFSLVFGCTELWQTHLLGFFNHSMQARLAVKWQVGLEMLQAGNGKQTLLSRVQVWQLLGVVTQCLAL